MKTSKLKHSIILLILTFCAPLIFAQTSTEVAGAIEGSHSVSPSGAAMYNIPISVAKGVGDLVPQISLTYNSQAGNGTVGYGWNISGISSITRGHRSVYFDNVNAPLSTADENAFYLDGMRLICTSGTPGTNGAVYKTEEENFSKITLYGSGSSRYFELKTNVGTTYRYGTSAGDRLTNNGNIIVWMLESVEDKDGNTMGFQYNVENNYIYIREISYGTNKCVNASNDMRVTFTYESRSDITYFSLYASVPGNMSKRLSKVSNSVNGYLYKEYSIDYNYNNYSYPIKITEKGSDGTTLKPTYMSWNYSTSYPSIVSKSASVASSNYADERFFSADFDGDGKSDLISISPYKLSLGGGYYEHYSKLQVYFSQSTTTAKFGSTTSYLLPSDFDWDNSLKSYVTGNMAIRLQGNNCQWPVLPAFRKIGNVSQFGFYIPYADRHREIGLGYLSASSEAPVYAFGDLDNDGREEIIYIEKGSNNGLSYPGRIASPSIENTTLRVPSSDLSVNLSAKPRKMLVADFDQNGFADILVAYETGFKILYNNNNNTTIASRFTEGGSSTIFNGKCDALEVGDFNGDGYPDLIMNVENSTTWKLAINNRAGGFTMYTLSNITLKNTDSKYFTCLVQDFNDDGKSDVVITNRDCVLWCQSTGTAFSIIANNSRNSSTAPKNYHIIQGDFMGCGKIQIMHFGRNARLTTATTTDAWHIYVDSYGNAKTNKVTHISNGLRKITAFDYSFLSNADVYTPENSAVYPIVDLKAPLVVVKTVSVGTSSTPNASSSYNTNYKYEGGKLHLQGKGFMGFRKITATGNRSTTIQTYDFNNTYYKPYLVKQEEQVSSNQKMKTTVNSCSFVGLGGKRYEVQMNNQQITDHLNNNLKTITYSNFELGTPKEIVTSHGNVLVETRTTELRHDTLNGNWVLGLPSTITIKKEADGNRWIDKTANMFNGNNQLVQSIAYTGDGTKKVQTNKYTYNTSGQIVTETTMAYDSTDELTTVYSYSDDERFITQKSNPLNTVDTYEHDRFGRLIEHKNHKNASTLFSYDGFGRLVSKTLPDGSIETITREENSLSSGAYKVTTAGTGQPTRYIHYDYLNREVRSGAIHNDNKNVYIEKKYGSMLHSQTQVSHPTAAATPSLYTNYTYDIYDRIIQEYETGGKNNTWSYSTNSVTESVNGVSRTKNFDAAGRLINVVDAAGTVMYNLRPDGQPTSINSPGGSAATVSFTYDAWGRQTSINDPSGGLRQYAYDTWGNRNIVTDARNNITTYTYDKYGRLLNMVSPETSTNYVYSNNELVEENNSNSNKVWTYDNMGRLIYDYESGPDNMTLQRNYTYTDGNLTTTIYTVNGSRAATTYNRYQRGWLTGISYLHPENVEVPVWSAGGVNDRGQMSGYDIGPYFQITYDDYGYPMKKTQANGREIPECQYSFNHLTGNLVSRKIGSAATENYNYDNLDRLRLYQLENGTPFSITYDVKGNHISKLTVGNLNHQLLNKPYQVSGLNLSSPTNVSPHEQVIIYTSFGTPSLISENGYTATWSYDSSNSKNKMVVMKGDSAVLTRYYLGGQYEKDVTPSGTIEKLYVGGDYYTAPGAFVRINGRSWGLERIDRDYLGNIIWVSGRTYDYTPYGQYRDPVTQLGNYDYDRQHDLYLGRGYGSHEHLPWFGLINMNSRLYDPALGRFLSPDPYVQMPDFSQSFNRYSYCMNNPLKYSDPDGEAWWLVPVIAAAVFGVGNTAAHAFRGDINSVWDGFKYFGQGAVTGFALGSAWQFAPMLPFVGQSLQTGMTWYAYGQVGVGALGTVAGGFNSGWKGVGNGAKAFLGNFYLDENNFWGGMWHGVSRHTWEMPQSFVGHAYTQYKNTSGDVDRVDFLGGATFATNEYASKENAVSLSNYINVNIRDKVVGNFDAYATTTPIYMHEYGHYIDSHLWGPTYLFGVGIPSIISASKSDGSHKHYWTETRANRRAIKYFNKHFKITWDLNKYPLR